MNSKINWYIISKYFKGSCSKNELAELIKWINSDNRNKQFFEEVKKTWEVSGNIYKHYQPDMTKGWKVINSKISVQRKLKHTPVQWFIRIAAVIILVIGITFLYNNIRNNSFQGKYAEHINRVEDIREIILPDSTIVTMNKNSSLKYIIHENKKVRRLKLNGEAYFNVKPDKNKPFIIQTNNVIVKVLGTSFNIKSDENIEVTVTSGKVAFYDKHINFKKIILKKDDKGIYNTKRNDFIKMENDNLNFLSWKTGELQFKNEPLAEVCKVISEYYHVKIQINENNIKNISVTTKFDNQSLEEIIKVLSLTLDLQYKIDENNIVSLYSLKNQNINQ